MFPSFFIVFVHSFPCSLKMQSLFLHYTRNEIIDRYREKGLHQLMHHAYRQYRDNEANRDNDQQRKREPAEHHGGGAHAALDDAVAKVLRNDRRRHRGRVLPQHRHEHKDGRDEDDGERDLRHGARGDGADDAVGALGVFLFVPRGKRGEEEDAEKGKDDGNDSGMVSFLYLGWQDVGNW